MNRFILILLFSISVSTTVGSGVAAAADTIEVFDIGASDAELHLGHDGLGLDSSERSVGAEAMLGLGLIDKLSAFILYNSAKSQQNKSTCNKTKAKSSKIKAKTCKITHH